MRLRKLINTFSVSATLVVLSIASSFILIKSTNLLIDGILAFAFSIGLMLPIWANRATLIEHLTEVIIIGLLAFIVGFALYGFSYGLSSFFIFPIIYNFAAFSNCIWPLCYPKEGLYISGIFYATIIFYMIIFKYRKSKRGKS